MSGCVSPLSGPDGDSQCWQARGNPAFPPSWGLWSICLERGKHLIVLLELDDSHSNPLAMSQVASNKWCHQLCGFRCLAIWLVLASFHCPGIFTVKSCCVHLLCSVALFADWCVCVWGGVLVEPAPHALRWVLDHYTTPPAFSLLLWSDVNPLFIIFHPKFI